MPVYTYECGGCGHVFDGIYLFKDDVPCEKCGAVTHKLMGAPSFKMKGYRAENNYGGKFVDTPGKDPVTGVETGYSFTSNRGETIDHNHGQGRPGSDEFPANKSPLDE
jgi:putative FmdB family regulatory protein